MRVEVDLYNSCTESQLHLQNCCNRNALRLYIHFICLPFSLLNINLFWKVKVDMWQWPLWISPSTQTLCPINGSIIVLPNAPQRRCLLSPRLPELETINKHSRRKLPVHFLLQFCLFLCKSCNKTGPNISVHLAWNSQASDGFKCTLAQQKCQGHSACVGKQEAVFKIFDVSWKMQRQVNKMLLGQC